MKVLITGHKGYIGSHLMREIKGAIGLDIKDGNDIVDSELPDVDVVIHLAAQSGVVESMDIPVESVRTNVYGTVRLWEKYKDTKFIFASTGGAIQNEISSPYGLSKYCAELLIKLLFSNYVILRFANVYGRDGGRGVVEAFLDQDNKDIVIYGNGSQTRTFVHIDDLLRGIIASIGWPKGEYYFGSDDTRSILELAEATGKPIIFKDERPGELHFSELKNTAPGWKPTINVLDYIKHGIKHIDTKPKRDVSGTNNRRYLRKHRG